MHFSFGRNGRGIPFVSVIFSTCPFPSSALQTYIDIHISFGKCLFSFCPSGRSSQEKLWFPIPLFLSLRSLLKLHFQSLLSSVPTSWLLSPHRSYYFYFSHVFLNEPCSVIWQINNTALTLPHPVKITTLLHHSFISCGVFLWYYFDYPYELHFLCRHFLF